MRLSFTVIGGKGLAHLKHIPAYAIRQEGERSIDAVVRSLERATGLARCAGPRREGRRLGRRGEVEAWHYAMTLGRPVRGGGYSPVAEVWVAIPAQA